MLRQLVKSLPALSRRKKRSILLAYDMSAMVVALWAAFSTRLGMIYLPDSRSVLLSAAVSFACGLAALYRLRIYHIVLRYFDLGAVTRILMAAAVSAIAWVLFVYAVNAHITVANVTFLVPRSVAFIYCGFLFLLLFMGRYFMALLLAGADHERVVPDPDARKIIIYGANATGISLADSVRAQGVVQPVLVQWLNGKQELIRKLLAPLSAQLEGGISITPENFIADGEYVAMQARGTSKTKDGKSYNNTYCQVFRIVDGKVKELTEYLDTELVTSAFGK